MSRRRSTSSAMGPPPDRDVVMGPPPVPAPLSTPAPTAQKSARDQEMHEKYRKLKRRFFELEEKHKETTSELQRSSERNVRMREERDHLLDRILELESQVIPNGSPTAPVSAPMPMAQPSSSAFPRTLLNARARTSFIANLREAIAEDDADDDVDPILASRHVGPEARRREEEERRERERLEEEARESQSKKAGRKTRSSHGSSGSHKGKDSASNAAAQPLMTFSPSAHQTSGGGSPNHGSPAPVLVSSTGTRLRIKPPKTSGSPSPPEQLSPHQHASSSSSSSRGHSHQRSPISTTQPVYTHPPPPPPPHFHHHPHQSPPLKQQHHRQHSLTPEQDKYRSVSPGGGMEVDVKDDPASSNRGLSPPPPSVESSYARHDNQYENQGRDLPNPERAGNADGRGVSPTFPLRSEVPAPAPAPSPPPPAPVEEPVPQRRSTRTRKSTRVAEAQATQRERSPAAPPPAKRARTSSTRAEAKRAEAEAAARARAEAQAEAKRIEEEERVKAEEEAAAKAEAERLAAGAEAKEKAQAEASTSVEAETEAPISEAVDAPISEAEENVTSTVAVAEGEISPESRSPSPQGPTPSERYDSPPSPIHDPSPPPAAQSPAPEPVPATATAVATTVSEDVRMEDATQPGPETATTDVPGTAEAPVREPTPVPSPPQVARSPTSVKAPSPAPAVDEPAPPAPVAEDVSMEDVSQPEVVNAPQPVEKESTLIPPAPAPARDPEPALPTPPAEAHAVAAASLPTPVSATTDIPHPVPEVAAPAPLGVPEAASAPKAVVQEAAPVSHETTPEMENIVKVAEAAIAAQNAAANANAGANAKEIHAPQPSAPAPPPVQESSNIDPNLDPSLAAVSANQLRKESSTPASASSASAPASSFAAPAPSSTPGPSSTPAAPNVVTTNGYIPANNGSASVSPAPPTPSAASPSTPSPSLSGNPYLSLSTMIPKMPATGSPTPTSAVGSMGPLGPMNPYSMYYPPGTPITPTTPGYPHPYNPYYYLAAPLPGPSGMYPSSPSYTPPSASRPPSDVQRHAKPKRLKAHTVTSKSYSIPMVPRDKKGKPMLPLNVGIMTVINLGAVCMREHFHTERYIFPVGYEVTRRYLSTIDPNVEVVYHCTILDGGDGPKFQIVPSDIPDRPVIAGTATGAWSSIVKQANAIRNRQHSNSVSGPDFFGLGQNTIKHLIQELPNANRLRDYVWQNFVEGGPLGGRHAAVIPALPEEYDASHPIGAYYPSLGDRLKREAAAASPSSPRGIHHYPQHIQAQARAAAAAAAAEQQGNQPSTSPPPQQTQQQPPSQGGIPHPPQSQQSPVTMLPGSFPDYRAPPQMAPDASRPLADTRANSNTPGLTPPPPSVPATFASIMNAYPVPGGAPPNQPGGSGA